MQALHKLDHSLSLSIYNFCSQHALLKPLATIISLTGDEAVCFPLPILVGFPLLFLNQGVNPEMAMMARRILRIYGDLGAMCLLEQAIKAVVRYTRLP
jgi:hypothetical protein